MHPIAFPARPRKGGPLDLAIKAGAYGSSEPWLEPKFNGWRAMIHTPSGAMFNRQRAELSIRGEFAEALARLRDVPFEWLDCEALDRRHEIGRGALIVLDWIVRDPGINYRDRRRLLATQLYCTAEVDMELFLEEGSAYLSPSYPFSVAQPLWLRLQKLNEQLGCVFYEGVVAKQPRSSYPIQSVSPEKEFPDWVKHASDGPFFEAGKRGRRPSSGGMVLCPMLKSPPLSGT